MAQVPKGRLNGQQVIPWFLFPLRYRHHRTPAPHYGDAPRETLAISGSPCAAEQDDRTGGILRVVEETTHRLRWALPVGLNYQPSLRDLGF